MEGNIYNTIVFLLLSSAVYTKEIFISRHAYNQLCLIFSEKFNITNSVLYKEYLATILLTYNLIYGAWRCCKWFPCMFALVEDSKMKYMLLNTCYKSVNKKYWQIKTSQAVMLWHFLLGNIFLIRHMTPFIYPLLCLYPSIFMFLYYLCEKCSDKLQ